MRRSPHRSAPGLLAGLLLFTALSGPVLAEGAPPALVTVQVAKQESFTATARLPGRIKASTVAEVRPQVSGIISDRLFEEGSLVEKGQPLYKIEDDTYAAAVAAAKASVAEAEANFDLAVREAERAQELFASRAGSAQKRDSANATRAAADAAVQMSKAKLQSAEIDLDRATIRAPIGGVIGLSQATAGSLVSAQQTDALATIRALETVYVDVTQSANDLLNWGSDSAAKEMLRNGQATLILPNGSIFPQKGELRAAEPQVEPTTGMVTLRIAFDNPELRLLPGLFVEVELPQHTAEKAVLLPMNAVMRDQKGAAYVWIVENGAVGVRDLTILTSSGNDWVATGGINDGDQVITSGFQKIGPGAPVQVAPAAPAQGEAAPAAEAAPAEAEPAAAEPAKAD